MVAYCIIITLKFIALIIEIITWKQFTWNKCVKLDTVYISFVRWRDKPFERRYKVRNFYNIYWIFQKCKYIMCYFISLNCSYLPFISFYFCCQVIVMFYAKLQLEWNTFTTNKKGNGALKTCRIVYTYT